MKKIELTQEEISVIEKYKKGEFNQFFCEDNERDAMSSVIDKAEDLMEELDYYDADDIVIWFYDLYKKQQ